MMLIALDYDETYTRDPDLWNIFIDIAKRRGHRVICVTMRKPNMMVDIPLEEVIYTCYENKWDYTRRIGLIIDIWIDDSPHWILNNATNFEIPSDGV